MLTRPDRYNDHDRFPSDLFRVEHLLTNRKVVERDAILIASFIAMRWFCILAALGACGGGKPPPATGGVSLVLDIPNGALDPRGYTAVEVVLHEASGDLVRAAAVGSDGTFDLGPIDPSNSVSVEATLRNVSGAAVGYGRTATAQAFAGGSEIVVPVRRPIGYI